MRWRWSWWAGSLLVHATAVTSAFFAAPARPSIAAVPHVAVEFELAAPPPVTATGPSHDDPSFSRARLQLPSLTQDALGGSHDAQNIDTRERGERGDGRSLDRGQLLAERAEGVNLSPLLMNTVHADQESRIDSSSVRRSPQFRRSTPEPGYDPWVSLHDGVLLFRLAPSPARPALGAVAPPSISTLAGRSDTAPAPTVAAPGALSNQPRGGTRQAAAGVSAPIGSVHRAAGETATGHAAILAGHASTTSDLAAQRPSDDVDAEALATTLLRNAVAATVHGGPDRAAGTGGVGGGGAAGSGGGHDAGGRARPYGEGDGWLSLQSPDARYLRYFQDVRRRLDALWSHAFPQDEALQLHQGTVILRFVIQSDGTVRDVTVQRRSGIDAFDHNVAVAVTGARLPPIPPALQRSELHVTAPFVFRNPIVR